MAVSEPTLEFEAELHSSGVRYVIGCDEVGRGAIAGPVGVGLCLVDATIGAHPDGLRDSKLLSEKRREELAPRAALWARFSAVGLATAAEVDEVGIIAALGIAGKRALAQLHHNGANIRDSVILLDGSHDWLSPSLATPLRVRTRIKADRDCASVSAASVLAKVHRDRLMIDADLVHPGYGWASNKGYGSAAHFDAIASLGATSLHRHTWLKAAVAAEGDELGMDATGDLDTGSDTGSETRFNTGSYPDAFAAAVDIVNAASAPSLRAENA